MILVPSSETNSDPTAMASSLVGAKSQLRNAMKQTLKSLSNEAIFTQSSRVFEALKDFEPYKNAQRISIYLSMPAAEIQTDKIVRHALDSGKQVFVPYLHKYHVQAPDVPSRAMDMVRLKNVQDFENLTRDKWGIPSVDPNTLHERQRVLGATDVDPDGDLVSLDLMLVPGVAFDVDEKGLIKRLGHGRGFYDFFVNRYIAKAGPTHTAKNTMLLYGLALEEQLMPPASANVIPIGPHDRPLDGLITGDGQIRGLER